MTLLFRRSALVLLIVAALLWFVRYRTAQPQPPLVRTALIMGTLVEIRVYDQSGGEAEAAVNAAFAEMRRVEQLFSSAVPGSEVVRLSAATGPLEVDAETARVLKTGLRIAHRSAGAFDMTLGKVKALWGIETDHPRIPSSVELSAALVGVGPDSLQVVGQQVSKARPDLVLELGGIAKGYAVDRAIELLQGKSIRSAAVNAGGDIRLLGNRQGEPWRIGIQHPRREDDVLLTLPLVNRAVVTSGDYERFFERAGVRYHHIFDPATGRPARGCQSVTVIAADAMTADALATAAFVLGPVKGLALLQGEKDVEGLLVAADGRILKTAGLK